jgi:hypothetical protein
MLVSTLYEKEDTEAISKSDYVRFHVGPDCSRGVTPDLGYPSSTSVFHIFEVHIFNLSYYAIRSDINH